MGWYAPLGPPPAPRVETLGWGGPLALGGTPPPWPPPPWEIRSPRAGAPSGGLYKGRGRGQPHPEVLAPPSPCYTSSSSVTCLAKPCRSATVPPPPRHCAAARAIIINLSFPLAGSRRRRRHPLRTCVERGGAVRSALGSPVIGSRRERLLQPRSFERFHVIYKVVCRCNLSPMTHCLDELLDGSW